jgi:putative ribosome biogenesis GTPase RsgA
MTAHDNLHQTCARLTRAVDARLLAGDVLDIAQQLLAHLQKPCSDHGHGSEQGAGKSSLVNMLLGGRHAV